MNYERFTLSELIAFLNDKGFVVSQSSVLRYVQAGYAMLSKRIPNSGKAKTRVYYHPLTAIEIMTAALLFKGDFLEPNSTVRLPRFNAGHLYYARLNFYLSYYHTIRTDDVDAFLITPDDDNYEKNLWNDYHDFHFEFPQGNTSTQHAMNPSEIQKVINQLVPLPEFDLRYSDALNLILNSSNDACTIAYNVTFVLLLAKYRNELLSYGD